MEVEVEDVDAEEELGTGSVLGAETFDWSMAYQAPMPPAVSRITTHTTIATVVHTDDSDLGRAAETRDCDCKGLAATSLILCSL